MNSKSCPLVHKYRLKVQEVISYQINIHKSSSRHICSSLVVILFTINVVVMPKAADSNFVEIYRPSPGLRKIVAANMRLAGTRTVTRIVFVRLDFSYNDRIHHMVVRMHN